MHESQQGKKISNDSWICDKKEPELRMNIMKRKSMSIGKEKKSPTIIIAFPVLFINKFWQNRTLHTRLRRSKRTQTR